MKFHVGLALVVVASGFSPRPTRAVMGRRATPSTSQLHAEARRREEPRVATAAAAALALSLLAAIDAPVARAADAAPPPAAAASLDLGFAAFDEARSSSDDTDRNDAATKRSFHCLFLVFFDCLMRPSSPSSHTDDSARCRRAQPMRSVSVATVGAPTPTAAAAGAVAPAAPSAATPGPAGGGQSGGELSDFELMMQQAGKTRGAGVGPLSHSSQ
jgi:hypothetical protein